MYQVIISLGGAGQQTAWLADISNVSLYAVFAAFSLVAPACLNYFGLRPTLCFGGFGYGAYAASLWCYNHTGNEPFVIFGGCWCGLSAAFLWTAEGVGITGFASENKKGLYVCIVWSTFQLGGMIGAAIPVALNWSLPDTTGRVGDGTYVGLMALMLCGAGLALLLYPWHTMVREDGTRVAVERQKTFSEEVRCCATVLNRNRWLVLFAPMAWAGGYILIYQSNDLNGIMFGVRARALNTFCSCAAQAIAAWILQLFTDRLPYRRKQRAFWSLMYVAVTTNAVWIGGYFGLRSTRRGLTEAQRIDVYDSGYAWWCLLYAMYGFTDATYACYAYWVMGALSNDPAELSVYVAIARVISSACMLTAFALDYKDYSTEFMFGSSWAFLVVEILGVLPIIKYWLKDTNLVAIESVPDGKEKIGRARTASLIE